MVDLSAYLDPDDDEPPGGGDEAQDLAALKDCLKALADAIASTNLAVLTGSRGDTSGAGSRVQASVAALKRFSVAFAVLDGDAPVGDEAARDKADEAP